MGRYLLLKQRYNHPDPYSYVYIPLKLFSRGRWWRKTLAMLLLLSHSNFSAEIPKPSTAVRREDQHTLRMYTLVYTHTVVLGKLLR